MIILDTHIWVRWILEGQQNIPSNIAKAIRMEDQVAISAISCFEVAQLVHRGRIVLPLPLQDWIDYALAPSGIECFAVTCGIAQKSVLLPEHHRDPADRIIIATALHNNAYLASLDSIFPRYKEIAEKLLN